MAGDRHWAIALGLLGAGLLAASMVGIVYLTRPAPVAGAAERGVDWSAIARFEGQAARTGGVEIAVEKAFFGDAVNPVVREPVRATCQDEVVLRLRIRNLRASAVTLTPGVFALRSVAGEARGPNHQAGFDPPQLPGHAERVVTVGFPSLTNVFPCRLLVAGDTLRDGGGAADATFDGAIDVCPGMF